MSTVKPHNPCQPMSPLSTTPKSFLKKVLKDNTLRFIPVHRLHASLGPHVCAVLPALHSLTGCDITSKVGTKKSALKANPVTYLTGFGISHCLDDHVAQQAEEYLVHVIYLGCKLSNFDELRVHQFRHLKSSSHQNLPPTTQGLKPHIYRAFYNAYCTMHVLDKQLNLETANLDPLEYGFVQDNEYLVPATSWRILETSWSTVCNCNKCARASCSCRSEMIKCCVFCKCHKTDVIDCRNPYNS